MLDNQARQRVQRGQVFQRLLAGAGFTGDAGLALGRQLQLIKQHLTKLLRRSDVELVPGRLVNLALDLLQFPRHFPAQPLEQRHVEPDAVELQLGQDLDQRDFQIIVESAERGARSTLRNSRFSLRALLIQLPPQKLRQPPGNVGVFAGIRRDLGRGHLVHAQLIFPFADQVGDGNHLVVQVAASKVIQVMAAFAGVQEIIGYHRVAGDASQLYTLLPEHDQVVFDVLIDLGHGSVFEHRPQFIERFG